MKRLLQPAIAVALVLCLVFSCCACGKGSVQTPGNIVKAIKEQNNFSKLNMLSNDKLSSYFQFKDSDVKRFCVMVSDSEKSSDTIACFEPADKAGRSVVISGISQYLTTLSTSFKTTIDSEYTKIQNRILMETESLIVLVICAEPKGVAKQLEKMGAKQIY